MEQGNLSEAIEALSEVVKLDTENLSAYSKLAELFEKQGKLDEAIQQYLAIGSAFLKNRLFKKAQEMFQKIVSIGTPATWTPASTWLKFSSSRAPRATRKKNSYPSPNWPTPKATRIRLCFTPTRPSSLKVSRPITFWG